MFQKLRKKLKGRRGQSLAEFAVTTAMMATLATTAAPKFSGVGEGAKEKKTLADIDKIVKSANNFYNEKVTSEGRGRFPGQVKYNESVPDGGGYQDESSVVAGLDIFQTFEVQKHQSGHLYLEQRIQKIQCLVELVSILLKIQMMMVLFPKPLELKSS
mgnify:CR=1 FL=1